MSIKEFFSQKRYIGVDWAFQNFQQIENITITLKIDVIEIKYLNCDWENALFLALSILFSSEDLNDYCLLDENNNCFPNLINWEKCEISDFISEKSRDSTASFFSDFDTTNNLNFQKEETEFKLFVIKSKTNDIEGLEGLCCIKWIKIH